MSALTVTFSVPDWIKQGVDSGLFERVGGIIRNKQTKRIVAWLRETSGASQAIPQILSLLPSIGGAASILNLGVSTMGFALILYRLHGLDQRLQAAQVVLNQINEKIDLGFHANLGAALDLAENAFRMTDAGNRKVSAMQAINRLAEARHHYIGLVDMELAKRSQIIDELLSTLVLAYVAEARCYLQLEELDNAHLLLEQGTTILRSRAAQYVSTLLSPSPAIFLHPCLKGQIDLRRLTLPFRWLNPELDENGVFEKLRGELFDLARQSRKWTGAVPPAIWDTQIDAQDRSINLPMLRRGWNPKADLQKHGVSLPGAGKNIEARVYECLPAAMETIEATIEDFHRFEGCLLEIKAIQQLGLSFEEWQHLTPSPDLQPDGSELMYIVLPEPINVAKEDV